MKTNTKLVLLLSITSMCYSWHSLGHLAVARIAEYQLKTSPIGTEAFQWATSLLQPLTSMCGEDQHPFTECATWPDKVKSQNWKGSGNWHFKNMEYIAEGFKPAGPIIHAN
jgi:S1/P1 Nuclease